MMNKEKDDEDTCFRLLEQQQSDSINICLSFLLSFFFSLYIFSDIEKQHTKKEKDDDDDDDE
jgi:hypothetical protein